jgi:hypothetical protein
MASPPEKRGESDPDKNVKDVATGLGIAGGVVGIAILVAVLAVVAVFAIGFCLLYLACGGH